MQKKNALDLLSSNEEGAVATGFEKALTIGFIFFVVWYLWNYGLGGDLKL